MVNGIREYFHLLWLAAIVLCAAAAIFATLFTACSRAPAVPSAPEAAPAESSPSGEMDAVSPLRIGDMTFA